MIHLQNIEKRFGSKEIFRDLSWHVKPGQRVGLIGPNGAGKSTLIKIIVGEESADAGEVIVSKSRTIGYLRQDVATLAGRSIREEVRQGLAHVLALQAKLNEVEQEMATAGAGAMDGLMALYGDLQSEFERVGGFRLDNRVEGVLTGLGFKPEDYDRDCGELSGGWQMRVVLARLLLQEPDVLLLDEPTNHLDLESLVWLEGFLQDYAGSLVFISHDRWFLNRLASHIAELSRRGVRVYTGNFEAYLRQAVEERELLVRRQKNQQRRAADLERFIARFRAKATKAKQVQSRIKALEKMEQIDIESGESTIHFSLPEPPKSGRVVMTIENGAKSYGDLHIYRGLDTQLVRGQRIALVGANGAGKSTLLKLFAGVTGIDSGRREIGFGAKLYYFAQHQVEALNLKHTVLQEAATAAEHVGPTQLRSTLGAFLFSGDDVDKRVGVLSGGEKARLALVKMLLTPANVLLLDEPTNHLDMASRAVLEEGLTNFTGTLVLISHDRHFVDAVCNEVWEVGEGRITPFLGGYTHYTDCCRRGDKPEPLPLHVTGAKPRLKTKSSPTKHKPDAPTKTKPAQPVDKEPIKWNVEASVRRRKSKEEKRRDADLRKIRNAQRAGLKKSYDKAEREVQEIEGQLAELQARQSESSHYENPDDVRDVAQTVARLRIELDEKYREWEAAGISLEALDTDD